MNRKLLRPSDAFLISFLVPVVVMIVIFVARGIFPFGEQTFLRTDMYHQYAPFFSEYQYKLRNGGSLLYSWDLGLGVNFSALFAYYLASPLNLLVILCPKNLVIEFMTMMIVFKMGACGVTMTLYLRRHFGEETFGAAYFGIFYALSGYLAAYSWNIMWLDCILLFPLILLGVEKLYRGEGAVLYTLSLAVSILSNYYISIMICMFLVLYFLCLMIREGADSIADMLKRCGRFAIYSILAGGIAAVLLLPEICALRATASGAVSFPKTVTQYFTILDMFARHIGGVQTEQGLDHWPNLYCGTMVFLLLPLYFMHPGIRRKEKTIHAALLIFFFLSFSVNVLNFIWHGLHYPNSLPCRQSFIYVFLVLCMCYEVYLKRASLTDLQLAGAMGGAVLLILVLQKLITEDDFHFAVFYAALLLCALYYLFFRLERSGKYTGRLEIWLLVLVTVEAALNMTITSVPTTSRTAYTKDNADVHTLVSGIRAEDPDFYRFEKMKRKSKDDGAWMNFPSVSVFSSTAYKHCSDFFKKIGCEAATNAYSITGSTPLVNMLFSVKYNIYSEEPEAAEERALTYISGAGDTFLYRAECTLPPGFVMSDEQLFNWYLDIGTPALVQDSLCDAMEVDPVLVNVLGTFENDKYRFTADLPGEYYIYVNNTKVKEVKTYIDGNQKSFDNVDRGFLLELDYLEAGEEVTVQSETKNQKIDCDVYRFDYEALLQLCRKLGRNTWQVEAFRDTEISGTVDAGQGGMLITSIPYDKGWKAYVDGEEAFTEKVLEDTFVGVRLTPGSHHVRLRYFPEGLLPGALISGLSLLVFLLLVLFLDSGRAGKARRTEPVDETEEDYQYGIRDLVQDDLFLLEEFNEEGETQE